MAKWQSQKLGTLIESVSETFKFTDKPVVFLNTSDILAGKFLHSNKSDPKTLPGQAKKRIRKGDLLFSEIRPANKRYALVDFDAEDYVVSTKLMVLRPKGLIDTNYIALFLTSQENLEYLQMVAEDRSGTFPQITFDILDQMEVLLPLPSEQKAIAAVLSSLDDKIDLLHRQNKTLEAMAETLFRQWFIVEAKDDWEEKPLGDIAAVQNGFAFSSEDYESYQDGFLEVFKMGHIKPGGGLRFSPKADYVPRTEKLEKWILKQDDIVMAMTDMKDSMGILGHPAMVDISNKYVLNQRVARIYLENLDNLTTNYFIYLQLNTSDAIALLQSKANSGVQVNLSTEAIKSLLLIVPPKEVQNQILEDIKPIFEKKLSNRISIQTLEKLRDTLLPKLMSGEVRVDYGA